MLLKGVVRYIASSGASKLAIDRSVGGSDEQWMRFKVYHNTLCTKSQSYIRHVSMSLFSPFYIITAHASLQFKRPL
jgi:hypothetical protein